MNMERGWKGLTKVGPVRETPLAEMVRRNCWLTSSLQDLQKHLGRVAFDKGRHFNFKVITDVSLISAWLYSANEVFDADAHMHKQTAGMEDRYSRIEDLVEGWDLLIIRLGVKTARNVAAPEVLLEALQIREQQGRATWIVDSPGYPLSPGHISFDVRVGEFLELWDHRILSEEDRPGAGDTKPRGVNSAYSGVSGKSEGRATEIPTTLPTTRSKTSQAGSLSNSAAKPGRMPSGAFKAETDEGGDDISDDIAAAAEEYAPPNLDTSPATPKKQSWKGGYKK
jgi:hypothetical protein